MPGKTKIIIAVFLLILAGCSLGPKEKTVSLAVTCSDDSVNLFQATCFVTDASGKTIDTKKFNIDRDKKEFWTKHSLTVPSKSFLEINLIGKNSNNLLFKAVSKKIDVDKENQKAVYLSLEQPEVKMDTYTKETVKVSGSLNCPGYTGKIEIDISSKEAQQKTKFKGDFPELAAKLIIDYSGPANFSIDVPANLGPSAICFFRLQKEEPPFCKDIDIGSTNITGLDYSRL